MECAVDPAMNALLLRAASHPQACVLCWIAPFEDLMLDPDAIRQAIIEIEKATVEAPSAERRAASAALCAFLNEAADRSLYVCLFGGV
jgi:hypothetical protein